MEKHNPDIKQRVIKLTLARPLMSGQMGDGDNINVNFDRVQAFGKVTKKGIPQTDLTILIMNTTDETIYVHESPKQIKDYLSGKDEKSLDLED